MYDVTLDSDKEIWKAIKGYEGYYEISNYGRVKSLQNRQYNFKTQQVEIIKREKILKSSKVKRGYYAISLVKNGESKSFYIHRLIAIAFIKNEFNKPVINHIDENKENNNIDNLEWCTQKENIQKYGNIKIKQYDKKGNLIKIWNGLNETARKLNLQASKICLCCQGKRKSTGGYVWRYGDE